MITELKNVNYNGRQISMFALSKYPGKFVIGHIYSKERELYAIYNMGQAKHIEGIWKKRFG